MQGTVYKYSTIQTQVYIQVRAFHTPLAGVFSSEETEKGSAHVAIYVYFYTCLYTCMHN